MKQYVIIQIKLYFFYLFWLFYFGILPAIFVVEFQNDFALYLSLLTLFFFTLGYIIGARYNSIEVYLPINTQDTYKFYYLYIVLLGLSSVIGNLFTPLFAIISAHLIIKLNKQNSRIMSLLIIILSTFILLNQYTRMYLLMMYLYIFIFNYIQSKKFYIVEIILLGITSFIILILMLYKRTFGHIDTDKIFEHLSQASPSDIMRLTDNYYVYEVYLKTINYFPNIHDYLYGSSLLKIFVFWIPRDIWDSKPEELTTYVGRLFYGTSRGVGYSTGMTLTGEFYINFGIFGVIILSFVLGYLSIAIISKLLTSDKEYVVIIALTYIIYFPHITRGGISLTIISELIFAIIFILFFKTSYLIKKIKFCS